MLFALIEVLLFALGLTGAVVAVPYVLWTQFATTQEQMLDLMLVMPLVIWTAGVVYWRSYEAARVGMVRLGYYASVPSFARTGLPGWTRLTGGVQRLTAIAAAAAVLLFP